MQMYIFWPWDVFWWLHRRIIGKTALSKGREGSITISHQGPIHRQSPPVDGGGVRDADVAETQQVTVTA